MSLSFKFDSQSMQKSEAVRLKSLDMLRGLAAILVVLFHYTTRFSEIYPNYGGGAAVSFGHVGVQVFFLISGYVIFMSLERIRGQGAGIAEFAKARVLRLYPLFWISVLLTFSFVAIFGLPGREVGFHDAILNLTMIPRLIGAEYVDGVYWTLEVELIFYFWIAVLHRFVPPKWMFLALFLWLLAGVGLTVLPAKGLLFSISRALLISQWVAYFALGIGVYWYRKGEIGKLGLSVLMFFAALAAIRSLNAIETLAVAAAYALLFIFTSSTWSDRHLPFLVWLGVISYPLYLIHQNIGYAILVKMYGVGIHPFGAIASTILLAILIAWLLHFSFERPLMRYMKRRRMKAKLPQTNISRDSLCSEGVVHPSNDNSRA